ncbi:hypothetical protein BGZ63DRAFT_388806 [Mariannaea sp. PMI_226]|nr:hypothetical protein BGZ63DRAFT_388806 [Mariannaea sp. PMI_226]
MTKFLWSFFSIANGSLLSDSDSQALKRYVWYLLFLDGSSIFYRYGTNPYSSAIIIHFDIGTPDGMELLAHRLPRDTNGVLLAVALTTGCQLPAASRFNSKWRQSGGWLLPFRLTRNLTSYCLLLFLVLDKSSEILFLLLKHRDTRPRITSLTHASLSPFIPLLFWVARLLASFYFLSPSLIFCLRTLSILHHG